MIEGSRVAVLSHGRNPGDQLQRYRTEKAPGDGNTARTEVLSLELKPSLIGLEEICDQASPTGLM